MFKHYSHCTYCGSPFPVNSGWPRTCSRCGNTSFRNPIPVCVVLIPVGDGVLAVRRAIPPCIGELALPGGYVNYGETWQEAGAREVFEETGLQIAPSEIREFRVRSAGDGSLIIFATAQPRLPSDLPPFEINDEVSERLVINGQTRLAFRLHEETVHQFFEERVSGRLSPLSRS